MCEENGYSSPATSMRPFQGPGVSTAVRGKILARSASASPVFRSKATGRTKTVLPFSLKCAKRTGPRLLATSMHPFQGPGVSTTVRGNTLARSASASPVFRSKTTGSAILALPAASCCMSVDGYASPATSKLLFRGSGCAWHGAGRPAVQAVWPSGLQYGATACRGVAPRSVRPRSF